MIIETLKNGEQIHIRSIALSDASLRHKFFYELTLAQVGMVHTVDEIDIHADESYEHISDFLRNKKGLWLIAINQNGDIIGEVDITIKNLIRVRHNGNLTIGVLPQYQNLGLGTALIRLALKWAKAVGLFRVELSVFQSNTAAIRLYEKNGFLVEGVRKKFLRTLGPTEAFIDDILMAHYL
jgi:RimJ/RimL family protein N-acetyltransferase